MKSTLIDRITVSIYEETFDDKVLLEILNRQAQYKFRGQKLKDIVLSHYRSTNPELVREIENNLKGLNTPPTEINNNTTNSDNPIAKKKEVKGMASW